MSSVRLALLLVLSLVTVSARAARQPRSERANEAALANTNLGAGYLKQGRLDLAIERLQRAIKQNPRLADAHSYLGLAYDQLGMLDDAEAHYKRATQLESNNAGAANTYAVFLCRQNRWSDAEPYFKRATENPTYSTPEVAFTNAGVCARHAGATDKAGEYFRNALVRNPTFPDALSNMMEMSYSTGNFMQARAFVQRFLDSLAVQDEQPDQLIIVEHMQQIDLRILFRGLTQPMREQRMIFAQLTADHQYAIERADIHDGHAEPGRAIQFAVQREIALPQTEIDVAATHTAQQVLQQVQLLECRMR